MRNWSLGRERGREREGRAEPANQEWTLCAIYSERLIEVGASGQTLAFSSFLWFSAFFARLAEESQATGCYLNGRSTSLKNLFSGLKLVSRLRSIKNTVENLGRDRREFFLDFPSRGNRKHICTSHTYLVLVVSF